MPLNPNLHECFVTATDVATFLNVNVKWVYSACRIYGMPHHRLGRYVRFRKSEVQEWLSTDGVFETSTSIDSSHGYRR